MDKSSKITSKIFIIFTLVCLNTSYAFAQGQITRQAKKTTVQSKKRNSTQYTMNIKDSMEPSGYINGHAYVDLGLPSGLKWATYNVGADSPEKYGDYFAWGETSMKENYKDNLSFAS